ncbi:MAG: hypothetical protein PHH45_00025 [Patescibacteria group bacterium]|nr:hypothetical protein [Patescibacteria group bacterium]HPL01388.1 hypothetical protein [bacterium]
MANKSKQRATVFSSYWNGGIEVIVSPPRNVSQALTAAAKRANKDRGCSVSYSILSQPGVSRIEWGDILPTKSEMARTGQPPKPLPEQKTVTKKPKQTSFDI